MRVNVPATRETEFYRWFADWRDGNALGLPGDSTLTDTSSHEVTSVADELSAAVAWWRLLRPSERAVWGLWIDAAPKMLKADEIVKSLGLKGPRDIPGILSWVTRKGQKVGFDVAWRFRNDPIDGSPSYGLENVAYADLLSRARDIAEAAA